MGRHCNSYGFTALGGAVAAASSWSFINANKCSVSLIDVATKNFNYQDLQPFLYIAIIAGLVVFALSCFDLAGVLAEVPPLFFMAAVGIFAIAGVMGYSSYQSFHMPCYVNDFNAVIGPKSRNVFEMQDQGGIILFALHFFSTLMYIMSGLNFLRQA